MEDVIQSTISLPPKEEIIKLSKHREWNLKCNITYNLREKRDRVGKYVGCDLNHNITYSLMKK